MTLRENLWQFVVLGLAVTLVLSIYADLDALLAAFRSFDTRLLAIVLALTLGNQLLRFVKWEYLLGEVDVSLPTTTSFYIFGSGLVMIMTPGKVGEVWKAWLVRDTNETPIATTMPVIAVERISDLLGVVCISLLGVLAFDRSPVVLFVLLGGVVGGVVLLQYEPAGHWVIDHSERLPVIGDKAASVRELYENSKRLLRVRPLGVTTGLSIVSWGLECVGLWLVVRGFGGDISVVAAAFVFAVASILGAVSLLPGGLGVTEGSMTGLLLVFGVSSTVAASATIVIRAATLWFVAGLALLVYGAFRRRRSMDIRLPEEEDRS